MELKKSEPVDWEALFAGLTQGKTIRESAANRPVFLQGDPADSVFYIRQGEVKLTVTQGKEAVVAILVPGEFFGEGCLAGRSLRMETATAITDCILVRVEKTVMARVLHKQHSISELFLAHLLSRTLRYEEDLVDHLCNSSEKRLARMLLLLSKEDGAELVLPRINQGTLAKMVGTTRSRASHFINKFKKRGFIDDNGAGELTVQKNLLSAVLNESTSKAILKTGRNSQRRLLAAVLNESMPNPPAFNRTAWALYQGKSLGRPPSPPEPARALQQAAEGGKAAAAVAKRQLEPPRGVESNASLAALPADADREITLR